MNIDQKIDILPLTKSNPDTLASIFGISDITPMWVADMDFEIAKPIQKALKERISGSGLAYEYKPASFYQAQQDWYKGQYNLNLEKESVIYSPSITTTISIVIEHFTEEGDGIIIQPPVFMEFGKVIQNTKRRIVKNPLQLVNGDYKINFDHLEKVCDERDNKILILCNPHNPVGRVWKKEELDKIVEICKRYDLLLISDEIHKDIILFNNQFRSVLHSMDLWEKIIVCTSEAKTFNLCGISDSIAIIPDENLRQKIKRVFQKYNLGRTNALTRVAMESAYLDGHHWLDEVLSLIESNVNSIEKIIESTDINFIKPEGTYQVWLDFRNIYKDSKVMFRHITDTTKIGFNAGHWFGREGALFMRMNIATSHDVVVHAMTQIISASKGSSN